jgi:8-amino-7-oxononanoate synthase
VTDPHDRLRENAERRRAAGLRRTLVARRHDDDALDLAGNDYLGLARDPRVVEAAVAALHRWGAGATGSRLVTGSTEEHHDLEDELAEHLGAEAALVLSSGYTANLSVVTALAPPGSLIVSEAQNHASLIDACRLSRAAVAVVASGDVDDVRLALEARGEQAALVVSDSVFSVDGGLAPVRDLADAAKAHDAWLLLDEAHALGVVGEGGRGAAYDAGLAGAPDLVLTATLSKALGSQGGAVLATRDVVDHVVDTARPFIFDTALAPAAVGAARAALRVLREEPDLPVRVRRRAHDLADAAREAGWTASQPQAAVTALLVGEPQVALTAAAACLRRGVRVGCFRPPSVPDGVSRLRLTARADLSDADVAWVRDVLAAVRAEVGA